MLPGRTPGGAKGLPVASRGFAIIFTVLGVAFFVSITAFAFLYLLFGREPAVPSKRRLHRALYDDRATIALRPVSPLAGPCLVPKERRFIVAGQVDRIASPAGAAALWRHWDEPSILWRPRGHITAGRSAEYDEHLSSILVSSGLTADPSSRTEHAQA